MFDRLRKKTEECEGTRKILICRTDQDLDQCRAHVARLGGRVVKELPLVRGLVCELPDVTFLSELEASNAIKRIDDDIKFHTSCWKFFQNNRDSNPQPQEIGWGIRRIGAPDAWPASRGARVRVGVIDTGIDLTHPDLRDRLGRGYNATGLSHSANDDNGHGTHVAGIIAASDNDFGVVGVAPEVTLYPVKVLDSNGGGSLSDVIEGIQWCIEQKMDVVNMSLGSADASETFKEIIQIAAQKGLIIVAAAGNSGPGSNTVDYPAKYSETLAVAACDVDDQIADFSSRGAEVDISAPGVDIRSTYNQGRYSTLSGTSMAAPHVTGTIALLKAVKPHYNLTDLKSIFKHSAIRLPNYSPDYQGVGLIQAGAAINKYAH